VQCRCAVTFRNDQDVLSIWFWTMPRPSSQFCFGCSLSFGVIVILLINLVMNMFYVITAFCNIILKIPAFGSNESLTWQTVSAAFALLGLPFIFAGFWGVFSKLEGQVRLYFYYLVLSFAVDFVSLLNSLLGEGTCSSLPTVLQKHGSAFACGFMRVFTFFLIVQVTVIQLYFLYTVWSYCEDLKCSGCGPGLPDLLKGRDEHHHRRRYLAPHGDEHFHQYMHTGLPVGYGAFATPGIRM